MKAERKYYAALSEYFLDRSKEAEVEYHLDVMIGAYMMFLDAHPHMDDFYLDLLVTKARMGAF